MHLIVMKSFVFLLLLLYISYGMQDEYVTLRMGTPDTSNPAAEQVHPGLLHRESPVSPLRTANSGTKSLILRELQRDLLRSRAIADEISLAANGFDKSNVVNPVYARHRRGGKGFASPLVSGIAGGSGDYFARIGVGTPVRHVYMVADTGSDISWIQCAPCKKCYRQQDPIFNPSMSSSFKPLSCESSLCVKLKVRGCSKSDHHCMYQVSYGDGSFTVGDFSTETLRFGKHDVTNVAMGCGRNNQGLFHGAAGLLGLGRGPLSFPTQTNATFSYCLPRRDSVTASELMFGPRSVPAQAKLTPILDNQRLSTYYYVSLSGIRVGGSLLKRIPPNAFVMGPRGTGGVILDSGTAITRLTTRAYVVLRDAFRSMVNYPSTAGISLFDTCYDLSGMKTARVPSVALEFAGGATMALPADGILVNVDDQGTYCLAFAPEDEAFSIIGNVQQQTFRISIDNANKQMGITPDQCG